MRKTILGSMTSLLLPLAAYGLPSNYGYQRKIHAAVSGSLLHENLPNASSTRPLIQTAADSDSLAIKQGVAVRELVVMDAGIAEADKIVLRRALKPGIDLVEINSAEAGLPQLMSALSRYKNLAAIHVVSHAEAGAVLLGNSRITSETIQQEVQAFAALKGAMSEGGDLLFYGCDLAANEAGEELLDIISNKTGMDVTASNNSTGNPTLKGDWELEVKRGNIETELAFSEKALADFSGVLAPNGTFTFSNGAPIQLFEANPSFDFGDFITRITTTGGSPEALEYGEGTSCDDSNGLYVSVFYNESKFYIHADPTSDSFALNTLILRRSPGYETTSVNILGFSTYASTTASATLNGVFIPASGNTIVDLSVVAGFSNVQKIRVVPNDAAFCLDSITFAPAAPPNDSDATLIDGGVIPGAVDLSTTISSVPAAIEVFDFTIDDGGGSDGLPTEVSQIVVNVSGTSTDDERSQITWRLNGPDASNISGTYNAVTDTITFSTPDISVPDGEDDPYTINAFFNNTTGLTDGRTITLNVNGDDDLTVDASGTQMSGSNLDITTTITIDVEGTQLAFTTQPAGSVSGIALTTQPVVVATDAAGNTDLDFTETITLTQASAGSLTNNTQAAVAGVATFTNLIYTATADQQAFTLTASGSGLETDDANSVTSDVVATQLVFDTQPAPLVVQNGQATSLSTVPVVSARDAGNLVDTGYSTAIILTEFNGAGSAALSAPADTDGDSDTVSINPASGIATFTGMELTYTAAGSANETFNLRASSGGLTVADSSSFTATVPPFVTSVNVPVNGTYKTGDTLTFTVNTSENVTVSGTPRIAITVGSDTAYAEYSSGSSGPTALAFTYTIVAGDLDSNGIALAGVIDANGGTLQDGDTNNVILTLNSVASTVAVLVDGVAPTISSVDVPANDTYTTGETLSFTVNTTENVTVTGTPYLPLTIGGTPQDAEFVSGSGDTELVFSYTIQAGDSDADGIAVGAALALNGGTMRDGAGNDLNNTLNAVGATTLVLVDAVAPSGHSVSFDDDTINGSEAGSIGFTFAAAEVGVDYSYTISSSGGGTNVTDTGSIATASDPISGIDVSGLNDGTLTLSVTLTDGAGNSATAVTDTATLDASAPAGHSVSFDQAQVNDTNHTAISYTFSAAEVGADYAYTISSSAGGTSVNGNGTVASAGQTISGIDVSGLDDGTLTLSVTLTDTVGNAATAVTDTINKDASAPTVDSVAVTDGDFAEGDNVTVTVTLTEDVDVAGGTPTVSIDIGATTRQATFTGEAGEVLTFSYTVQASDNTDGTGVTVLASSIDLTGGITVQDAGGNAADLTFNQVSNPNAQVDTVLPADPAVTDPASAISVNTADYELAGTHGEDGVVINLYADADNNGVADNATVLVSTSVSGGAWAMTHTLTANSDNNFVVVAEDAAGNISAAVDVPTITHDNVAPAAPAAPDLEAASDSGTSDTDDLTNVTTPEISGTAEANATVTLSSDLDGEVGSVTADGSGDWILTTNALSEGEHSFTAIATDAAGNDSTASTALTVTVDATGPSLSALADQRLVLGNSTGALAFTLADNVTAPADVTLTPTSSDTAVVPLGNIVLGGVDGNRTVEITGAALGVSTVDIEAGDEAGNTATESLQVRVNTPPAISGSGADTLEAGTSYSFTPNASDVDGDTLTFSISNRPSWASFNTNTGRLSGTPPGSGSFSGITISVSDGLVSTALAPFTISVSAAANTPPVINGTPPTQVTVGEHYHFAPTATDADGDSLSFSASGVPAWLLFDAATGSLSGIPGDAQVGTHSNIVISVSDGTDSVALAAFSITVAPGEDSDDDGVSDYQEGLDETDPNDPEDYVDTDAPQLTAPAPQVFNADGLFTAISLRQLLGLEADADEAAVNTALAALVIDRVDGEDCCTPSVQDMSEDRIRLRPGRQAVTWVATDRKGNETQAEQTVDVRPLVSFGKDRQVGEGGTATIPVLLNGPSPVYPFTVPYVIDSTSTADEADYDLPAGSVTFTETEGVPQVRADIVVDTFLDETAEGDETVLLRLDNSSGSEPPAADAEPDSHNINVGRGEFQLTISEANLAPQAHLQLWQGEATTVRVVQTGGEVTVSATVSDPNPLDSPTLSWTGTDAALLELAEEGETQLTFDPAALAVGAYRVRALATDTADASGSAVLNFVVLSEPPVLSEDEDSDNDGLSDAEEGSGDSNGNGIPDYLDPGYAGNVLPLQVGEAERHLAECEPGADCRLGRAALTGTDGGVLLSPQDLADQSIDEDPAFEPVGGIFDFEIDNLPSAGLSAEIVLPLTEAIPAEAVYRKYLDGEWVDFTEDSRNSLASAPGELGYCPSLTLPVWEAGLVEGYHCVRLLIEDGGPNDADGEANSAIADPGAVSRAREDEGDGGDGDGNGDGGDGGNGGGDGGNGGGGSTPGHNNGGGGGALGTWWLPLLLVGWLRRRRKNTGR